MSQRIVVTGLGVLTANAGDVPSFFDALKHGVCGVAEITQFDTSRYSCKVAGEIKDLPLESGREEHLDRASKLSLLGVQEAVRDAGLDLEAVPPGRLGVCFGTTCGGMLSLEQVCAALEEGTEAEVPDWYYEELSFFAATNHVARAVRATGPVMTLTIACASGSHAVGAGIDLIRAGKADVVITGGVDVISRFIFRGFHALNGLGSAPYRAFDRNRKGVVLGEGVGVLVLESLEFARARGARMYAELLGHSFNNDGCHIVYPRPDGEGIARSLRAALRDARIGAEDVDHINAHGTGTIANDSAETAGIKTAFGARATEIPVASIKPMVGHTSGAAGAIELIASIASLQDGFVPPTVNFEEPDPACDLDVSSELRKATLDVVLSANSGFGGSNAAVVVSRLDAREPPVEASSQRVVVTGYGVFLPGIRDAGALWDRVTRAEVARGEPGGSLEIPQFNVFAETGIQPTKDSRRMDQFSRIAVMGVRQALQSAGVLSDGPNDRLGLVLGSAYACLESNATFCAGLGKAKVNPVVYQNTVSNAVTGYLAMVFGIHGPVSCLNQGLLSGSAAIAYGSELVRSGRTPLVLAGGVERLCNLTRLCLDRAGLLSRDGVCHPFESDSTGFLPSDGAAFLLLESLESARARGATIYGELHGYGFRNAPAGPDSAVVAGAIGDAWSAFGAGPSEVTLFAGAAGLAEVDAAEREGMVRALERTGASATVTTVKRFVGEPLGAGGPVSVVAGLLAARHGLVPGMGGEGLEAGTGNIEFVGASRQKRLDSLMISSTDADGSCVVLALSSGGST